MDDLIWCITLKWSYTFVPLQRDSDGEQDGASHADRMHGIEEVWEEDDVCLALHAEAACANVIGE